MFIIAGLGNPTSKYEKTRHNVGFDCIDYIAEKYQISVKDIKGKALVGSGYIEGVKVLLVKPQTYMNLSGEALLCLAQFYKVDPEQELLVVYDDISLAPGQLRIRKKGSAGGHNGMKNIIALLGTQNFPRVKIGVGEKPAGWDLADYVLSRFSKEERQEVENAIADAAQAVTMIVQGDVEAAMNEFNGKGKK